MCHLITARINILSLVIMILLNTGKLSQHYNAGKISEHDGIGKELQHYAIGKVGWFIVLNATFNNISGISWRSVLLVEETEYPEKTTYLSQVTNFIT